MQRGERPISAGPEWCEGGLGVRLYIPRVSRAGNEESFWKQIHETLESEHRLFDYQICIRRG